MGKTTRWFKALFGIKSSSKHPIPIKSATSGDALTPVEVACLRAKYYQDETDRNNSHVIAVAAAEVVGLTCRRRCNSFAGDNLHCAAVTIQTNFRGYLARKALRALKAVVKVQALVRGYLVRKQANATLNGIKALFRAQATVQSIRASSGLIKAQDRPLRNGLEIEQYYITPISTPVRSRRLSAIDKDIPKVIEVDMDQNGSRSGRAKPGQNSSFSDPLSYQMSDFQSHSGFPRAHHYHRCHYFNNTEILYGQHLEYNDHPNYMANTMSFKGKVRSQSAPKRRPENLNGRRHSVSDRKRMPLKEIIIERRSSLSEVTLMQRSCSHLEEAISLKNVVIGNIEKSPF